MKISIAKSMKINILSKKWESIKKAMNNPPVEVDLSSLEKWDTAGMQFVLYLLHLEQNEDETLSLSGLSENMKTQLKEKGFPIK